jgi:mannose-1-phosphate guanylyltransferase
MKAFLLAAGNGTRLRPLTDKIPKCLVPIREVSMLEIWLEVCRRAGIDEILLNLHAHADVVREALDGIGNGLKVTAVEESALLGSAGTLLANREWIASEAYFWILYADVLTNTDLTQMLAFHREGNLPITLGVTQVKDPSRCGVATFDERAVITEFVEKPATPTSNWGFSGIMLASPQALDVVSRPFPVDIGFDLLPQMVGRMRAYRISEYLLDIGTLENYELAQRTWPGLD